MSVCVFARVRLCVRVHCACVHICVCMYVCLQVYVFVRAIITGATAGQDIQTQGFITHN